MVGSTFELTIPLPKKANLGLGTAHPDGTPELTGKGRTRRRPQAQQPNLRVEAPATGDGRPDGTLQLAEEPERKEARRRKAQGRP